MRCGDPARGSSVKALRLRAKESRYNGLALLIHIAQARCGGLQPGVANAPWGRLDAVEDSGMREKVSRP